MLLLKNPFVKFYKKSLQLLFLYNFFSIPLRMIWNIKDNRKLILKMKSKFGLYHVVLTIPKTSSEKPTLNLIQMQQLPDFKRLIP